MAASLEEFLWVQNAFPHSAAGGRFSNYWSPTRINEQNISKKKTIHAEKHQNKQKREKNRFFVI